MDCFTIRVVILSLAAIILISLIWGLLFGSDKSRGRIGVLVIMGGFGMITTTIGGPQTCLNEIRASRLLKDTHDKPELVEQCDCAPLIQIEHLHIGW